MFQEKSVLICGIGETASAIARRLFLEGHLVALYRAEPPYMLRRCKSYADVWFDACAFLDGVEARRADVKSEFLLGLRTQKFIPLHRGPFTEALEAWPWDVIIAAKEGDSLAPRALLNSAELTIGLGRGFVAGEDCDLVIEIDGADPGGILRSGDTPKRRRAPAEKDAAPPCAVLAPTSGLFKARMEIGATVAQGEILGFIKDQPLLAPIEGRILGVVRKEQAVLKGAPLVEIARSRAASVAGISVRDQLISRSIAFVVEMESEGMQPLSFEKWPMEGSF
jgi:xanthine dehydrogenase accessory factor